MIYYLFFFSLFFCLVSYLSYDPLKSCFFLIFSMLCCMPMLSFCGYVWFSYFICMLFLSGIFVILVYFSSLSSYIKFSPYFYILGFIFSFFFVFYIFFDGDFFSILGLNIFYYFFNFFIFFYLVIFLLFFMTFVSYFLSFSGALRSI